MAAPICSRVGRRDRAARESRVSRYTRGTAWLLPGIAAVRVVTRLPETPRWLLQAFRVRRTGLRADMRRTRAEVPGRRGASLESPTLLRIRGEDIKALAPIVPTKHDDGAAAVDGFRT